MKEHVMFAKNVALLIDHVMIECQQKDVIPEILKKIEE